MAPSRRIDHCDRRYIVDGSCSLVVSIDDTVWKYVSATGSNSLFAGLGRLVGEELDSEPTGRVCADVDVEEDSRTL